MTTESSLPHRRASCGRWRLKWMVLLRKGMKVHVGKTKMMVLEGVKARHNVLKEAVCLLYHDDRVILAPSACKLRKMATKMDGSVKKRGMKVHVGKTKMMNSMEYTDFKSSCLGKRMKERQYNGHALYQWRMSIVLLDLRS
ncbi:hypothetical protein EVAR_100917_1 [Eumeta japonica]|uniref:Reverse transcriptase domain-containing protein n=1 Tax=Eumeta variegata TaxID=151549 RepID=A0A4C2A7D4_EUMVA|nr:hypothetical protein EVAR_100917_1 [Eumeta japonica]